jgi:DNA-binding CsgD family transcriptional regulator
MTTDLFEAAPFGLCVVDLHGGVVYRNQRCSEFCGHTDGKCHGSLDCPFGRLTRSELSSDVQLLSGFEYHGQLVDLAVFREGAREYRFVFPLDAKVGNAFELIRQHGLTNRELEIAALMVAGLPNGRIGEKLGVATNTIKSHIKSIYRKLPIKSHKLFADREGRAS